MSAQCLRRHLPGEVCSHGAHSAADGTPTRSVTKGRADEDDQAMDVDDDMPDADERR